MAPLSAAHSLCLWWLSAQTSCGFIIPTLSGDVFAASDTKLRQRVPALPTTSPVASTPAVIPPANGFEVGGRRGDGFRDVAPRAAHPSSTEFGKFLKRRQAELGCVVIDLRASADFHREHFVGATTIPASELEARLLELPPPFAQPLTIVGKEEDLRKSRDVLMSRGWRIAAEIGAGMVTRGREDWPTEVGSRSVQVWRANDFLEFCMKHFLLPSTLDGSDTAGERVVLDLGCGSGRDTVHMAQHLPPGTRVIGVDNHSYALQRGERLAEQWVDAGDAGGTAGASLTVDNGLGGGGVKDEPGDRSRSFNRGRERKCEWLLADLRKEGSLDGLKASVIHGHRFKCEQLLPLLRDDVLVPGGFFIWSTFLDTGTENLVPPWRPSRMMRSGELANIFSGEEFEILVDEHGELPTRGSVVPANFFACRKRQNAQTLPL